MLLKFHSSCQSQCPAVASHRGQFQNDCISFWYKRCFPLQLGGWLSDVVRTPPPNPPSPVRIVGGHFWRSVGYDVLLMLFMPSQWLYREECAWKRCYDAFSSGNFWEFQCQMLMLLQILQASVDAEVLFRSSCVPSLGAGLLKTGSWENLTSSFI